ncbi:PTS trehalose transporter subunit IIBC [Erysipelotrichaceae bacterium AM07-12]|uniref:PTS system trehalose-specific EIIBC component n=1 Tax=Longicatena caecimuris TaxID=1796635 RepID=UPI000E424435|nr:PTS system trehalose-specific EIIBC component [Longicatena caecimuris]RGD43885.1 PTS trehalose transporter subunit IIBC [Erysipelotrichaceae bacterium AM07-12]RGD46648.1 PTS trehalose transporter subunit IIBC [Erysipelotrichaceae bacterium AM07-35-1]
MSKFNEDVKLLLTYVGGKENIKAVSHCVTRMRFVLADPNKADIAKIEALPCTKGTFTQSGQFQVIIGNEVSEFYNAFTAYAGIEGVSKDAVKDSAKSNQTVLQRIMGALGEIFAPLIPALICGGLILGFRNIIGEIAMFDGKTLAETATFWQGVYNFLWLIGEAVFHMLPVGIVWSITKKMGTTQMLGIVLGLTLVSPQLLNGFQVANTAAKDIPIWDFGFAQVQMIGYQGQVIAAMMAGFVLVYLEKFFRKHCPAVISMIVVPFCSLIPAVVIAHTIVGPIGWTIGNGIADIVYTGLTSSFGVVFAALFGLIYAPIVMTGLHHMTNAIDTTLTSMFGGTILWPMIALSNIAQGSSVLAMSVLQKQDEKAQQINIPAMISCYLGVTEPALFGVNLKYGFPLICGMIGSSVAAVISVGFGVQAFSIGVGGLPGIISIKSEYWMAFIMAMIAAVVIPFLLTLVVGKKKLHQKEQHVQSGEAEVFLSPMSGTCMEINEVADQGFASGAMGEGFAIDLIDGKVVAPFSGEIIVAFPTKHAYGIRCDNGKEILLHIGMDTVDLQGEGFQSKVKVGDYVKQGDIIVEVDLDYVKKQGKSLISPVVFTDGTKIKMLKQHEIVQLKEAGLLAFI